MSRASQFGHAFLADRMVVVLAFAAVVVLPMRAQVVHVPDPGMQDRFSSFEIPAKAGAPFRAAVVTAWKYRSTTNWNKHTIFSRRTIARDSAGRVFQERRLFSADGDHKPTTVSEMDFYDPASGIVLVYDPRTQQCRSQPYLPVAEIKTLPATENVGGMTVQRQSLGASTIDGQPVTGSEDTLLQPGATQAATVTEFWYAPQLAINLVMKRTNANGETQTFAVQDLDLHEPDGALFQAPAACDGKR